MTATRAGAPQAPLVTTCGRRIRVGRFHLDGSPDDRTQVTLDVGPERGGDDRVWASMSPADARDLAHRLLAEADRAENPPPRRGARPRALQVVWSGARRWEVHAHGRRLLVVGDSPGGPGPTPTQLLVASVAACAAAHTAGFLERIGRAPAVPPTVSADFDQSDDRAARITAIRLSLPLPETLTEARRAELREVLARCTVANTLHNQPHLAIGFR